jgi:hypothetical protein
MLYDTAVTIELCFAKIALTKNIQIILTTVGNQIKRAFKVSSNKI